MCKCTELLRDVVVFWNLLLFSVLTRVGQSSSALFFAAFPETSASTPSASVRISPLLTPLEPEKSF